MIYNNGNLLGPSAWMGQARRLCRKPSAWPCATSHRQSPSRYSNRCLGVIAWLAGLDLGIVVAHRLVPPIVGRWFCHLRSVRFCQNDSVAPATGQRHTSARRSRPLRPESLCARPARWCLEPQNIPVNGGLEIIQLNPPASKHIGLRQVLWTWRWLPVMSRLWIRWKIIKTYDSEYF